MSDEHFAERPQGSDWVQLYYDWVLKPFEVNEKIAKFLREVHGAQVDYWLEVQNLIEKTAYYMSEEIEQQYKMSIDCWVPAQKYIGILAVLSADFLNTAPKDQDPLQNFMEILPAKAYLRNVENLAQLMSSYASQQTQTMVPMSYFWPAAEYHIITAIAGAAATARTFQDVATSLTRILNFPTERYLKFIQKVAYYKWKEAGEPYGESLRYWLESESEILSRIQEGIGGSFFSDLLQHYPEDEDRVITQTQGTRSTMPKNSDQRKNENLPERFAATIYVDNGTKEDATELANLMLRFIEELGYSLEKEGDLIQGSWIKRSIFHIKAFLHKEEVRDRAKIVEDTLFGHAAIDVDERIVSMIAKLIDSLDKKGSSAAFDTGLFVFLKIADHSESQSGSFQFLAKRLTIRDRALLNDNPSILNHPDQVLKCLSQFKMVDHDRLEELRKITVRGEEDETRDDRALPPSLG